MKSKEQQNLEPISHHSYEHMIAPPPDIFQKTIDATIISPHKLSQYNHVENIRNDIIRQYNQKLIEIGYGLSRKELKKKDFIDLRPIFRKSDTTIEIPRVDKDYIKDYNDWCDLTMHHSFYNSIPCFQEGVYQINRDRYIYWNIKDLNIEKQEMTVFIMDYMACPTFWEPGVSGTVQMKMEENADSGTFSIDEENMCLFSKIYQMIPYTELHWNKSEIQVWESIIVKFAIKAEKKLNKAETNNVAELYKLFVTYTNLFNYFLAKNKPKAIRTKQKHKTPEIQTATTAPQPKKLTRTIGIISVKSEKPPKLPTEKTLVKYKVASWKTRGFIRHLKSGKTIYIKESIHHRKCLNETESNPPQTVIKIKSHNNKGE